MASVSFGLNRGADQSPDQVTVGTLAVSTNDVEVRIDQTKGLQREEIVLILQAIERTILDGRVATLPQP